MTFKSRAYASFATPAHFSFNSLEVSCRKIKSPVASLLPFSVQKLVCTAAEGEWGAASAGWGSRRFGQFRWCDIYKSVRQIKHLQIFDSHVPRSVLPTGNPTSFRNFLEKLFPIEALRSAISCVSSQMLHLLYRLFASSDPYGKVDFQQACRQ